MSTETAPLGQCGRVVDRTKDLVCAAPAIVEVLVHTRFGLLVVRLCANDYADHRKFYRENPSQYRIQQRIQQGRHRKHSRSTATP